MALKCRFYANRFPEQDEVVKVVVHAVHVEVGADVRLLEYNDMEGMILMSELTRRRIRSVHRLVRVGRAEHVLVMRVDQEKGYIDLSKRRVSEDDADECEQRYAKAKAVNSILCHVAELLEYESDHQLEDLYSKTAWHFDAKFKTPGAAYEAFKMSVTNPKLLDECNLDSKTKAVLLTYIQHKLSPKVVKVRADIEVGCTTYEGVDAIKRALKKGLELSTEIMPIKINLIAPPLYVVTAVTKDRKMGVSILNDVLDRVQSSIKEEGGLYSVQVQPRVVTDADEEDLARKLEQLENENNEISGDDSSFDTDNEDDRQP